MEFIDLINQHCPPAIQKSMAQVGTSVDVSEETLMFSPVTSKRLDASCAYSVVGHLSRAASTRETDTFKLNYLSLATQYSDLLTKGIDQKGAAVIRQEINQALEGMIGDFTKSHLQGLMLAVLTAYRIDQTSQIAKRIAYRTLSVPTYLGNWMFNEYALCMGDPEAAERIAAVFKNSGAQDLRVIFTDVRGKYTRGGYCFPKDAMQQLVRPYIRDKRRTSDVNGKGPSVSRYARELLDIL
jgi:hypothetical protein